MTTIFVVCFCFFRFCVSNLPFVDMWHPRYLFYTCCTTGQACCHSFDSPWPKACCFATFLDLALTSLVCFEWARQHRNGGQRWRGQAFPQALFVICCQSSQDSNSSMHILAAGSLRLPLCGMVVPGAAGPINHYRRVANVFKLSSCCSQSVPRRCLLQLFVVHSLYFLHSNQRLLGAFDDGLLYCL